MFRICALRVSRDNGEEGDKICRLMARIRTSSEWFWLYANNNYYQ